MSHSEQTRLTYANYLHLKELLKLQKPKSASEHEILFIVVHQCAELFFKCALEQSKKLLYEFDRNNVENVSTRISRLTAIVETASAIMKYQENLTPFEFAEFRPALGTASGAQSEQFKRLLADSTRYREAFVRLLQRRRLLKYIDEPEEVLNAVRRVYSEPRFSKLMKIADALYDYEEAFKDHRWQHLKVVRRVIGKAPGTGGTSRLQFLEERLASSIFEELTLVRSQIVNIRSAMNVRKRSEADEQRKTSKLKK